MLHGNQTDPGAVFVDSFMDDWGQEKIVYAFPPFSILHMVVQKIIQDKAEGFMLVPFWPSQPWFALLADLACKTPIVFEVNFDELLTFRQGRPGQHPLAGKLRMMTIYFSVKLFSNKGWMKLSSTPCYNIDDKPRINCTGLTLRNGKHIVTIRGQIPFFQLCRKHWTSCKRSGKNPGSKGGSVPSAQPNQHLAQL